MGQFLIKSSIWFWYMKCWLPIKQESTLNFWVKFVNVSRTIDLISVLKKPRYCSHDSDLALGWMTRVWFLAGMGLCLYYLIQGSFGFHPASCPVGATNSIPGGAGTDHETITTSTTVATLINVQSRPTVPQTSWLFVYLIKHRYVCMAWCFN